MNLPMNLSQINDCCKIEANLKEIERRPAFYNDGSDAGKLVTYQCQVCERKHYVHEVKPMTVGVNSK